MLIYVNITDRQTDGRTDKHIKNIVRNITKQKNGVLTLHCRSMGNKQASPFHIVNKTSAKIAVVVRDAKGRPTTVRLQPEEVARGGACGQGTITVAAYRISRESWDVSFFTDSSDRVFILREDRDGDLLVYTSAWTDTCELTIL